MGLGWHHLVFSLWLRTLGNGGRFLVSMADNVVVESSLLVEI